MLLAGLLYTLAKLAICYCILHVIWLVVLGLSSHFHPLLPFFNSSIYLVSNIFEEQILYTLGSPHYVYCLADSFFKDH